MIFRVFQGFAAVAAFVLLTGFGAGAPIRDVVSAPIPPNPAATLDGVQKAILRAGLTLGWQMTAMGPGRVEGVLNLRRHQAVVDITYDVKAYNITYRTSTNLDFDASKRTIHSNYNGWIGNLDKAIRAQVTVL
jgi:hypothetical protein